MRRFPSWVHVNLLCLITLLVPPVIRVKDNLPTLADKEVCIATCTAAGSKPPANVTWLTGSLAGNLRATANSTHHDNGTTTTVSYLFGVPTKTIHQQVVHCVVTSPALSKETKINFTIQVYCEYTNTPLPQFLMRLISHSQHQIFLKDYSFPNG